MNAGWEKLQADISALKAAVAELRERTAELDVAEIDRMLPPVRSCLVELIALRSSLERAGVERRSPA
jgi:hypothetical protein